MNAPVVIVDYNPEWRTLYRREKKLICRVLGRRISAIEHIGSTSVPNLAAKNIIDMMAGVNNMNEANECLTQLQSIGYTEVIPQDNNPDWYYCLGKEQQKIAYHLHLMRFDSEFWKKHLIFRDYLRKTPQAAQEYCNLKKQLAAKYGSDRLGYTEAKTEFIDVTVARAKLIDH